VLEGLEAAFHHRLLLVVAEDGAGLGLPPGQVGQQAVDPVELGLLAQPVVVELPGHQHALGVAGHADLDVGGHAGDGLGGLAPHQRRVAVGGVAQAVHDGPEGAAGPGQFLGALVPHRLAVVQAMHEQAAQREGNRHRLGSDRGSPNHGSTLLSKRVMPPIRSPARVST
jgi:hypothetical protein